MRLFFAVILGMAFFSGRGLAQEDRELSVLQQGVTKLAVVNARLAARNNTIKQQILRLQAQLGRLEVQGDLLNKRIAQLQDKNPRRAKQIACLEKENSDLEAGARLQKERLRLTKMIYDVQQRQESLHEAILEFQKNAPL